MIALRLLMPTLTSEAIESALGAVIERANATGALCHEETIGDYASFVSNRSSCVLEDAPMFILCRLISRTTKASWAISHSTTTR